MSAMTDNDFPKWLKEKREANSWSQSEFARVAGISRQVVSDYEGYKRKYFDEDILRKIARALKLPAETVFREAGKLDAEPGIDPWAEEMNHKMKLLPLRDCSTLFYCSRFAQPAVTIVTAGCASHN